MLKRTRRFLPDLLALMMVGTVVVGYLALRPGPDPWTDATCRPGYLDRAQQQRMEAKEESLLGKRAAAGEEGEEFPPCVPRKRPEGLREMMVAKGIAESRDSAPYAAVHPRANARAVEQRKAIAAQSGTLPGSAGTWSPLGKGPLLAGEEGYVNSAFGFRKLNGRITDFASAGGQRLFAAVGSGGLWETTDLGQNWRSIGDNLPTQSIGSVGFTKVGSQEVVIALTGDNAFGGNTYGGVGAFRSTDGGATWHKATGLPDGALGFKIAVDPTEPRRIYAATGLGLYRSTDAGESYANVNLPTTEECDGDEGVRKQGCFFANVVTDVVVQAPDEFGNAGGAVLAAVGWRAGTEPSYDGGIQAPANGIYTSPDGAAGSFVKKGFSGLVPQSPGATVQDSIGRTELGIARGAEQNHDYVYAVVQDARLFNKAKKGGIDVGEDFDDPVIGIDPTDRNTVLNGLYVSPDFGETWNLLEAGVGLQTPGNNSALVGVYNALGIGPGIQSWYDQWIQPNPTGQVGGVPTLLTFGLEEVWQNQALGLPLDGVVKPAFKVVGRYFSGDTCQGGLLPTLPPGSVCPTSNPPVQGTTTHPDQHAGLYLADVPNAGDVTLVAGNDGGVYTQTKPAATGLDNDSWGEGANEDFNTLIPYEVNMAEDGTVYGGLQDNGGLKIQPDGKQINWQGGDGFFAAVDPKNSQIAYGEVTGGLMYRTIDGGKTSEFIDPVLRSGPFATPFKMDPLDPKHLIIAGRDVKETTFGPETTLADGKDWATVYDLGTREHPGDPDAEPTPNDPNTYKNEADNNVNTAIDLYGDSAYVGYCGYCDPLTQGAPFRSGIATNVGGAAPPEKMTPSGWHIAAAQGLPERYITGVRLDPGNPRTVYVTLAGYYIRPYAPIGAGGEDTTGTAGGHVYKSTDAGETFTDISANLPDAPATDIEFGPNGVLVIGTNVGAFISETSNGGRWETLGTGLPPAPIYALSLKPNDPDLLLAATYGRGVYTHRFADPPPSGGGAPVTPPPRPPRPGTTKPGTKPGAKPGVTPDACAESSGFKTVSAAGTGRSVRLSFGRRISSPVAVDVFRVSVGRQVIRERLVARFGGRASSFTWNGVGNRGVEKGRRVGDGYYFVRYRISGEGDASDVRRLVVRRARGKFIRRPDYYRRAQCDLLKTYKLERPVFGGRARDRLGISYRVTDKARVEIEVFRGARTVKFFAVRSADPNRTYRLRIGARGLRRGDYRVRITATKGRTKVVSSLVSRLL